jgi:hypothetical protein
MLYSYIADDDIFQDIKPSANLLADYELYQYQDIVRALQTADITLFHQAKDRFESDFIRWSIFYLIDNLRLVMFRHVFRKLYVPQQENSIDDHYSCLIGLGVPHSITILYRSRMSR